MDRAGWINRLAVAIISSGGIMPFVAGCSEPATGAVSAQVAEESRERKAEAADGATAGKSVTPVAATAEAAPRNSAAPIARTAAKPVTETYSADVPPVLLASEHANLCKVNVGDAFPAIELPKVSGGNAKLADVSGKKATVVLFWTPDRWMAEGALVDLALEAAAFSGKGAGFVGIVEGPASEKSDGLIKSAGGGLTQLADADGAALAQVGESALPRVYVLDSKGKVAWFDIEYSEATRRELRQTLAELTK
jgi:peroxiredoxin